jgi:two-component system chemotaxis response regulator CheB
MNQAQIKRDVIVIGASQGGVQALKALCSRLPSDLPAIVGVVIHRSPWYRSDIEAIYHRPGRIGVREPYSGETYQTSTVYFAPSDYHMHFQKDGIFLNRGPKVNFTRPAVDVLFASAAESFGERVAGVVLTGGGADGANGLVRIKAYKGLSIVQNPEEAPAATMPLSAIREDSVDGVISLGALPALINALALGLAWNTAGSGRTQERRASQSMY